ncbi:hypothetical protein GQ55_2G354600 [Panicum hallii var. hallii]|uniref:Uncharacterized protein n=1 Tax=Panicum hallii var. hallii TaxID=1504633 RepID=A0A2T7EVW4_9POAL|nr:hypothetical protein GQ55_2G354600 [Panicum hallii var. hallii]
MASTMAIEGKHRQVYESFHGPGTFPDNCKAAEGWEDKLLEACKRQGIWKEGEEEGAVMGDVLKKTMDLGGVRTTSTLGQGLLGLRESEKHSGDGLTPERVAELLDQGPCIGRLWICPRYFHFDAAKNNDRVYRGCGRDKGARAKSKRRYGNRQNGSHVVVCFQYRFCGEQMHVLVLDNHEEDGPERWIDAEELDALFTLKVDCLCGSPDHYHDAGTSLVT